MDNSEINNRKRINTDAEELREKLSRETNKIMKLRVGQETTNWDFKEQMQQVAGNHECLQQQMVEVQMQHEALSALHLDELRHRTEVLNNTREIGGVLQDHYEPLKETLSRCKADQGARCEAYQRSGQLVRDIQDTQQRADDRNKQVTAGLEEKLKLMSEHQSQLLQMFSAFKQQANSEAAGLRAALEVTRARERELLGTVGELRNAQYQHEYDLADVGQETTNWDFKEQMQQVAGNHERLQQQMVEVQMQHEALSALHLDELRHRTEVLNNTREIGGVLQDHCERLEETLSRCKADQGALCEAYQRSGQFVRDIQDTQQRADDRNKQLTAGLEEKLKLMSEHQSQLLQIFSAFKQQADSEAAGLRAALEEARARERELQGTVGEHKYDLADKEEIILNLERDIKQLEDNFNNHRADYWNSLQMKDKEINVALEDNESLKQALSNHEQHAKSLAHQSDLLQEKLAAMQREHAAAADLIRDMKEKIQDAYNVADHLKKEKALLEEEKERCIGELKDKEQIITTNTLEIEKLIEQSVVQEKILVELNNCKKESNEISVRINELNSEITDKTTKMEQLQNTFNDYRSSTETRINELLKTVESKDKELDSQARIITQLMSENKTGTDVRSKLETALQRLCEDAEAERQAVREKHAEMASKIESLEASVKDKEESVTKHMDVIYEMRGEKERLQSLLSSMQHSIGNIHKELTGTVSQPPPQAAHDDNAVMLTPTHKEPVPPSPILQNLGGFVPRAEPKQPDNTLYAFSDSSMESDHIDPSEVNRRFNAMARGERVSPVPLSSLKRRRGAPALHSGRKSTAAPDENAMSPSQVKNDLKSKERRFFKNKRDAKTKKLK